MEHLTLFGMTLRRDAGKSVYTRRFDNGSSIQAVLSPDGMWSLACSMPFTPGVTVVSVSTHFHRDIEAAKAELINASKALCSEAIKYMDAAND